MVGTGALPQQPPIVGLAHEQGTVAGENAVGGQTRFAGSLGTQVVRVFELVAAATGLRDRDAAQAGYLPLTVASAAHDRNDPDDGRLHRP